MAKHEPLTLPDDTPAPADDQPPPTAAKSTGGPLGASIAERIINRPRRTARFTICLDPDRQAEVTEARQKLQMADLMANRDKAPLEAVANATEAREHLDKLVADTEVATFHLRAVGPAVVEKLMADYPPTKEQLAKAKRFGEDAERFDSDEVYPRLLAETIMSVIIEGGDQPDGISDAMSLDQVRDMWSSPSWPQQDKIDLATQAMTINQSGTQMEALGKG